MCSSINSFNSEWHDPSWPNAMTGSPSKYQHHQDGESFQAADAYSMRSATEYSNPYESVEDSASSCPSTQTSGNEILRTPNQVKGIEITTQQLSSLSKHVTLKVPQTAEEKLESIDTLQKLADLGFEKNAIESYQNLAKTVLSQEHSIIKWFSSTEYDIPAPISISPDGSIYLELPQYLTNAKGAFKSLHPVIRVQGKEMHLVANLVSNHNKTARQILSLEVMKRAHITAKKTLSSDEFVLPLEDPISQKISDSCGQESEQVSLLFPWVDTNGMAFRNQAMSTHNPTNQIETFLCQVAQAMASLHSKDLLHRDLKADNILVDDTGAKICDLDLMVSVEEAKKQGKFNGFQKLAPPEAKSRNQLYWEGLDLSASSHQREKILHVEKRRYLNLKEANLWNAYQLTAKSFKKVDQDSNPQIAEAAKRLFEVSERLNLHLLSNRRKPILRPRTKVYNTKETDVYAFGLLMQKMFQQSNAAHKDLEHNHSVQSLKKGLALKKLQLACTHPTPEQRPSFSEIASGLSLLSLDQSMN